MKQFTKSDLGLVFFSAAMMALASVPFLSLYRYYSEKAACTAAGGVPIPPKVIPGGKGFILDRCEMKSPK